MQSQTDLSTFNNSSYQTGASIVKRSVWYIVNAVIFQSAFPFSKIKVLLLRGFGAKIGKGVVIKPYVNIKYPWLLEIGDHTWIGEKVWIDNLVWVIIGAHNCLSQGCMLLTGNHNYKKSSFDLITGSIILADGVWIGAKAVVCPGVRVETHALLTVGSVTTKNMEAYSIYQGNPAKKIRDRLIS